MMTQNALFLRGGGAYFVDTNFTMTTSVFENNYAEQGA